MPIDPVPGATLWEGDAPAQVRAPPAILADLLDPTTREFLSLTTGDDPTDAAVVVALRTVRSSGVCVRDTGQKLGDARMMGPGLERFLLEEVRFALAHLIDSRQITLEGVTVSTGNDWAEVAITYINEATRARRTLQLPLADIMRPAA